MAMAADMQSVLMVLKEMGGRSRTLQMLAAGLPGALEDSATERHVYQNELIGMVRSALQKLEQEMTQARELTMRDVDEARKEHEELVRLEEQAAATESVAQNNAAAIEKKLDAILQSAQEADVAYNNGKSVEKGFLSLLAEQKSKRDAAADVQDGALSELLGTNRAEGEASADSMAAVSQLLSEIHADRALVAALEATFAVKPSERGPFDKVIEQGVVSLITNHVAKLEQQLEHASLESEHISSAALGAWAILEVSKEDTVEAKKELDFARKALADSKTKLSKAKIDVRAQEDRASIDLSKLTLQDDELKRLSEAIQALDRLEARNVDGGM
eukprot:TRINITY_DN55331_c0_g1_i1.p1 TRINITY_DN55331_c0_g1~~TRINITY_DN55331_c0_g1_i1.p1  ORF type:complete len:331 (+),score=89.43 TRINITY_DN55331_c0_g1_i1:66-1058(+)